MNMRLMHNKQIGKKKNR